MERSLHYIQSPYVNILLTGITQPLRPYCTLDFIDLQSKSSKISADCKRVDSKICTMIMNMILLPKNIKMSSSPLKPQIQKELITYCLNNCLFYINPDWVQSICWIISHFSRRIAPLEYHIFFPSEDTWIFAKVEICYKVVRIIWSSNRLNWAQDQEVPLLYWYFR